MSWLSGNDGTTFTTDLSSLFHNAATGELTPEQKAEIAASTTQEYNPCKDNLANPDCAALQSQTLSDIQAALPDSGCVLNAPFIPCFKSWGSVLFAGLAVVIGLWLLMSIIFSPTAYIRARG